MQYLHWEEGSQFMCLSHSLEELNKGEMKEIEDKMILSKISSDAGYHLPAWVWYLVLERKRKGEQ